MTADKVVLERINGEWVPVHYEVTTPEPLFTNATYERLLANEKRRRDYSHELDRDDLVTSDNQDIMETEDL